MCATNVAKPSAQPGVFSFPPTGMIAPIHCKGVNQMAYVRLSIARPRHGEEKNLEEIMTKLNDFSLKQPGCQSSVIMKPHDNSGEIARLSIYDSEASAEHIANSDHVLALRSQLHIAAEPGHVERAFFTA